MELPFRIVFKGLRRVATVEYECPRCKSGLLSPLTDAGKFDDCPDCGCGYAVPGIEALEKSRLEEEANRLESMRAEAEGTAAYAKRKQEDLERAKTAQIRNAEMERTKRELEGEGGWVGGFAGILVAFGVVFFVIGVLMLFSGNTAVGVGVLGGGLSALFSGAILAGLNYIRLEIVRTRVTMEKMLQAAQKPASASKQGPQPPQ